MRRLVCGALGPDSEIGVVSRRGVLRVTGVVYVPEDLKMRGGYCMDPGTSG